MLPGRMLKNNNNNNKHDYYDYQKFKETLVIKVLFLF